MPLTLRRNYLSQNPYANQFGFGWKCGLTPYLVIATNLGSLVIYEAAMDGTVLALRQGTNGVWLPTLQDNPSLNNENDHGVGSTGNLFNTRINVDTNDVGHYILTSPDGSVRNFEVTSAYNGYSGTNFCDRTRPYLLNWYDNRSNYFFFSYGTNPSATDFGQVNRIQSSSGVFLQFQYDSSGRINSACSSDDRSVSYTYDAFGDLSSVILPDSSVINYQYEHYAFTNNGTLFYDSDHLLVGETKPNGRLLVNQYDAQKRVTNQLATVGSDLNPVRNASFVYSNNFNITNAFTNLVSGTTLILDVFGNTNQYFYTNGLITMTIDSINRTNINTWYMTNDNSGGYQRSLCSTKDPRGLGTQYSYDVYGNVTNRTIIGNLTAC